MPVKEGEAIFALRFNAFVVAVESGLLRSEVSSTFKIFDNDLYISTLVPVIIDPAIEL